jgi:hypothetical protein
LKEARLSPAHQARLWVPDAEQAALCLSRNGIVLTMAALARGMRLSTIIKIDCLRIRPNVIAAWAQFAGLCQREPGVNGW